MCGILGGTNNEWNYISAIESLQHRGPDGQKIEKLSNEFTMAFARLSIIDLSEKGMQPMTDDSGDITITYNGELYGYIELRKELEKKGYIFKSHSDTEVLLNAYIEWGDKFVDHIDGMFALAIYDRKIHKVKLFRDRVGIKPLYWFYDEKQFAYASELKGILKLMDNDVFNIDNTSLYDYYNYLYIPEPKTIYKNIYKLEPAHKLIFDLKLKKIECNEPYWKLNVNVMEGDKRASEEKLVYLRSLISENVKKQMIADVSVGGFLSGGIDSSILTIEAKAINPSYQTYAMGFYDFETNELPYVECLENRYKFSSKKRLVKTSDFRQLYGKMQEWFDEPFADTSAYPTYLVSKFAKENCVVALSGDGGDEIFGGYTRYAEYLKLIRNNRISIDEEYDFLLNVHTYKPNFERKKIKKELGISNDYDECWLYRKYYIKDFPPITRLQYMDFYTYLPGDVLTKTDRVGMAVSLETRVPFLAKDIIEFAFSLSQSERNYNGELKGIIKEAYKDEIPNNLLYRKKWGFSIPTYFFGYDENPQERLYRDVFRIYNL